MIEVMKTEQLLAKDIIEYGAAFEWRRERSRLNPFRYIAGRYQQRRIPAGEMIIHKAPK